MKSILGYSQEETARIIQFLRLLMPYFKDGSYQVVGGLAIRWHLSQSGIELPARPLNDIDIIINALSDVNPDITSNFMIAHLHVDNDSHADFYLVPVDSRTRLKADIFCNDFPASAPKIGRIGDLEVPFSGLERQFVKIVEDIQKPLRGQAVDPKQMSDAALLRPLVDWQVAEKLWLQRHPHDGSLEIAIAAAKQGVIDHPELSRSKPHRKPRPYVCQECVHTSEYPITPMDRVFEGLGIE